MKTVVIGGTGLIGSKTVTRLRAKGHEVLAASPNSGVNTLTREGLPEALAGAEVVVDLANSPSFEDKAVLEFFETAGKNLLAAEAKAGVKHHIALSLVGTASPGERLLPWQAGSRKAHQSLADPLLDRALHPVHGIPEEYRRFQHRRYDRSSLSGLCSADRI